MKVLDNIKIDKTSLFVSGLHEHSDDRSYWHSKKLYERLQAVEMMRQINYGYDQSTARLQRVFEVAQRPRR